MTTRKLVLHFHKDIVNKAVVYRLIKDFNLVFNLLQAKITPQVEGLLIIELSGKKENFNKGLEYLKKQGVKVQPLSKDIVKNDDLCVHCGACVAQCPSGALYIEDPRTRKVGFDHEKCIACEACVRVCPYNAMEINY